PLQLLQSWIFWRFPTLSPHGFDQFSWPLASRWSRYLPTSDEKNPRLAQFRLQLDRLQPSEEPYMVHEVGAVAHPGIFEQRHFGGVQDIPGHPVNIDFLHSKDGRGGDRWFPHTYQTWHGMWDARAERVLGIHRVADPGASELYLRWWFLAGKRFLCSDAAHVDVRMTQVLWEASQRVPTAHEPLLRVHDVPDNRRPERRMRVGTRTTARDWQWVNQAMEEDGEVDVAPQRVRRLPEAAIGRRRRGGRGGQGRGGDEAAGGPDVPHTPGASTQGYVDETQQFFGSPGGTPPSAFVDGPSHMDADDQAPPAAEDPEPRRGRRAVRRRGCGTGGHM
ncbi:hypothetical protein PIB30_087818, partial [Stylosanthes scabra]|nr:hypothetical protein [Stylosanthes scabra]